MSRRYQPAELLAHRAPMLLLDEILEYDAQSLNAIVEVRPGKAFCDESGAPGWVGLEWMAQTAGAWFGAHQLDNGEQVNIGFLLGTRHYRGPEHFPLGRIHAHAQVVLFDPASGIAAMDCLLRSSASNINQRVDETILASARVKLYQPQNTAKILDQQTVKYL